MHESLPQAKYDVCVLPQVLHYRNLWERVTAWVLGKLQHYVPWDNEILLNSRTLGALFSQTTQLIKKKKASQFTSGWILEFLSPCSLQNEAKQRMYFKSNISRPPCTLPVTRWNLSVLAGQLFDEFTVHWLYEHWCKHTDASHIFCNVTSRCYRE